MKKLNQNLFCKILYLLSFNLFYLVLPTSGYSSNTYLPEIETISSELEVKFQKPNEVSRFCDFINIGVQVSGGTAPYTITWLESLQFGDELNQVATHDDVLLSWIWKVPNQNSWSGNLIKVVDIEGVTRTFAFSINLPPLPCYPNYFTNVEILGQNDLIGEECPIDFKVFSADNTIGSSILVGIQNSIGEIIYEGYLDSDNGVYSIPKSSLAKEQYSKYEVTEWVTLFVKDYHGALFVKPLHLFPNIIDEGPLIHSSCKPAKSWYYNNMEPDVGGKPVIDINAGTICLNDSEYSVDYGGTISTKSTLKVDGIGINVGGTLFGILKQFLKLTVDLDGGYARTSTVTYKFDPHCKSCITKKPNACRPNVPEAVSAKPILLLETLQREITVTYLDCDGIVKTKVTNYNYENIVGGLECATDPFDVSRCDKCHNDKKNELNFQYPDDENNNSGFIAASMTNGVAPFEYTWSVKKSPKENSKGENSDSRNGAFVDLPESGNIITGIETGEYCFTITDAECCTVDSCVIIPCVFNMNVNVENTFCNSILNTGSISLENVNGIEPISYEWSTVGFGSNLQNLQAGTYSVTATDADGCIFMKSIAVSDISETVVNAGIQPSRWCSDDGAIDLNVQGTGDDYTVVWDNGSTSTGLSGLSAGTYCVTVTDGGGCETIKCFTVGIRAPMEVDVDTVGICGGELGEAHLEVTGGEAPYSYQWLVANGTGPSATGLDEGSYAVIISDASGCQRSVGFNIIRSPEMRVYTESDIPCSGEGMTASVIPDGGTPPYSYLWSNGSQASNIYNVSPDIYTVVVTDAAGCTEEVEFDLNYTGDIELNVEVTPNIDGCGINTGSLFLEPSNGKAPYVYRLLNLSGTNWIIQSSPLFENLGAGDYWAIAIDACDNFSELYFTIESIENPNQYIINLDPTHTCHATRGAAVDLEIDGQCNGCSYQWSNGSSSQNLYNVGSGDYSVTVTDELGCEQIAETTVDLLENDLSFWIDWTDSCEDLDNGSASITDGNYDNDVIWSTGETDHSIEGLSPGHYVVTVTSPSECSESIGFYLGNNPTFNYEVEIVQQFSVGEHTGVQYPARVKITSNQFELDGTAYLNLVGEEFEVSDYGIVDPPYYVILNVPWDLQDIDEFEFTYTSPLGCIYEGEFELPTCNESEHFKYKVEHVEGPEGECMRGQSHTYKISEIQFGHNHPYYIEVTMEEAVHGSESGYYQKVEVNGSSSFYIHGVPSGKVSFNARNKCDERFGYETDNNCCNELICELISEGEILNAYDHGYYYALPFVNLTVVEQCFDKCGIFSDPVGGGVWDDYCSGVIIRPGQVDELSCWRGTITVTPESEGETGIIEVMDDADGNITVEVVEELEFEAENPGKYKFTIDYSGTDCSKEVFVNFYGPGHWDEYVNLISEGEEHYHTSGKTAHCNDLDIGDYEFDHEPHQNVPTDPEIRFGFKPLSFDGDPCDAGGEFTFVNYDDNGEIVITTIIIPPGKSKGGMAFNDLTQNPPLFAGHCLFDAIDVYGVSFDKLLKANYRFGGEGGTEPEDCLDPENYTLVNGVCLPNCGPDESCESGICENGVCIPQEEPCNGECPPQDCENGGCPEYACDFEYEINRKSGHNGVHKELNHNLPEGAIIKMTGITGNSLWFTISGAVDFYEFCRTGQADPTSIQKEYIITDSSQKIILDYYKETCSISQSNSFDHKWYCSSLGFAPESDESLNLELSEEGFIPTPDMLADQRDLSDTDNETEILKKTRIYPNPFKDLFYLEYNIVDSEELDILLTDIYGRILQKESRRVRAGDNTLEVKLDSKIPSGVYYISITNEKGESETFKMIHIDR